MKQNVLNVPLYSDDKEIQVIGACNFLFEKLALNEAERARIIEYLNQRYGALYVAP